MKLRLRLALTTVAVLIPIGAGLAWFNAELRDRAGEEALASGTLSYMRAGGRARCEERPDHWGGPTRQSALDAVNPADSADHSSVAAVPWQVTWGPPPTLFAYDADFHARASRAPELPEEFIAAMQSGRDFAARRVEYRGRRVVEVLVPLATRTGPCAYVFARGPAASPRTLGLGRIVALVALPFACFFAAILLAVGPTVTRIRRLTEAVRRSASTGYVEAVALSGDDELAELARAFEQAGSEIRAQLREKERRETALREFVANTTHDMMIPLTVLQGHLAALVQKKRTGGVPDERLLSWSMDEAHYMASLMHNLAIAAKLDASEPELHRARVDLNALVGRVIGRHGPIAGELEIVLESALPEEALCAMGDVTLLEQAVSNVVYNAIRHNRTGGHVAVILAENSENAFCLRVVDDGPGIPTDELSRLLERGFRGARARTRSPEGQGLGLHITFQVAELHGLALTFKPSEYGGLEVALSGPVA